MATAGSWDPPRAPDRPDRPDRPDPPDRAGGARPGRPLRLVVGLGNPGDEYEGTRHNVGFAVVDLLARDLGLEFRPRLKGIAVADGRGCRPCPVVLAKPLTFMNRSGEPLKALLADLDGRPEDVLVVFDDFHLDLGRLRVRAAGSDGGHNGLKSVLARLGTPAVPRLRLGIGQPPPRIPAEVFVLKRFPPAARRQVDELVERASQAARDWAEGTDLETLMNRYNPRGTET